MKKTEYLTPDLREIILSAQAGMLVVASGIETVTESENEYDNDWFLF